MTFKFPGVEFLKEEFDALAAVVGKLAEEVEFEIVDHGENGVPGRLLRRVESALGMATTQPPEGMVFTESGTHATAPAPEHKDVYQ